MSTTAVTIDLPVYGISVYFDVEKNALGVTIGGGSSVCDPNLYEVCPSCNKTDCVYQCDESTEGDIETEDMVSERISFNGGIDAILSVILSHAIAGIDIETPAYLEGIETAFDAISNN